MSENPYETMLPTGRLGKAVDKAIEEVNQRFLNDPEAQQAAADDGDRWRHILDAEASAEHYAVVLPTALAEDLLKILDGEETRLPKSLLVDALRQRTQQAYQRKQVPEVVERGYWRHEDGTTCVSHPDILNYTYVGEDERLQCQHGELHCVKAFDPVVKQP